VVGVRLQRVAGAIVDGGDAEGGEPRDIRPPVFWLRLPADRSQETGRHRSCQTGTRTLRLVDDRDVESIENLPQVALSVIRRLAGCETVVDLNDALVGDDVARHTTG